MVFDFGSEMYIWSGKFAPVERRKKAMDFAKDLKIDQIGNDVQIKLNSVSSNKSVILKNVNKADFKTVKHVESELKLTKLFKVKI